MPRIPTRLVLLAMAGLVLPAQAQESQGKKGNKTKAPREGAPMKVENSETPLGRSTWRADFDYSKPAPATEALWERVSKAGLELEASLGVASEALGGTVWAKEASLVEHGGQNAWSLRLFTGTPEGGEPKRVDLVVAAAEPKVLARTDLPALAEDDRTIWNQLGKADVQAEALIATCKAGSRGDQAEARLTEPHVRQFRFVVGERPYWDCELMGMEGGVPRRYRIELWGDKPAMKLKVLLDRFPGTPLRKNLPVELPNGMFLYDFTTGDGPAVAGDSKVRVHYRLFLLDNSKLHDTWTRNLPETFLLTEAPLKGMTEGMVGMRVGGKRKIAMPYELAFGEAGNEIVPPKSMVVCDVFVEDLVSQ